jgi:hypothetical protein
LLSSDLWHRGNAANWLKMQSLPALLQISEAGLLSTAFAIITLLGGQVSLFVASRSSREHPSADPRFLYAQAILLTALVSPHFFIYDCLILLIPALILLDSEPESPTIRVSLLANWPATWTGALRYVAFGWLPFPFWLLAAPALPLILGWLTRHSYWTRRSPLFPTPFSHRLPLLH